MDKPTFPTAFGTRDGVSIIYNDKAEAQSRQVVGEGGAAVPPLLSPAGPWRPEAQVHSGRRSKGRASGAEPSGRAGKMGGQGQLGPGVCTPLTKRPGKLITCSYNHSICKPCACVSHTCPKVHHAPTRHNCLLTAWRGPREEPETASTESSLAAAEPLLSTYTEPGRRSRPGSPLAVKSTAM